MLSEQKGPRSSKKGVGVAAPGSWMAVKMPLPPST